MHELRASDWRNAATASRQVEAAMLAGCTGRRHANSEGQADLK
jgi:hypothetical protein